MKLQADRMGNNIEKFNNVTFLNEAYSYGFVYLMLNFVLYTGTLQHFYHRISVHGFIL